MFQSDEESVSSEASSSSSSDKKKKKKKEKKNKTDDAATSSTIKNEPEAIEKAKTHMQRVLKQVVSAQNTVDMALKKPMKDAKKKELLKEKLEGAEETIESSKNFLEKALLQSDEATPCNVI